MTENAKKTAARRNVGEIILRGRIYYIRYYDGRGRRRLETTRSTKREDAEKQLRKRLGRFHARSACRCERFERSCD